MMWGLFALTLLVLPRFFLIDIDDTGIRVEDILLLLLVPATVQVLMSQRQQMGSVISSFGMYFGVVALASSIAGLTGTMSLSISLAFGLRPALYACAFVIGWNLGLHSRRRQHGLIFICIVVLGLNLTWGVGAVAGVFPNVASFDPSRLSGLTNGPYELSSMICLISVALLRDRRSLPLAAGAAELIWTQSRVALMAFILYSFASSLGRRFWLSIFFTAALGSSLVFVLGMRDSSGLSLSDSLEEIFALSQNFSQVVSVRDNYFDLAYSTSANNVITAGDSDHSMLLRVARWSVVLTTASHSFGNLMFGMGPGFYSVALDGNYVRLVGETGLLGLLAFLLVGCRLHKSFVQPENRRLMLGLIFQLAVVAIFIDVFVSLKTMCLFWMLVGALQREDQEVQS